VNWIVVRSTVSSVWAAVGPLIGVLVGGWLTSRNQRRHWLADNKKQEYRELLTSIAGAGSKLLVFYGRDPIVASGEELFRVGETARESVDVIYNRLFIVDEIRKLNVLKRWEDGFSALRDDRDVNAFGKAMDSLMDDIRNAALKEFG